MGIKKCKCGTEISVYRIMCDKCAEKFRFEKAKKISIRDYEYDFVYDSKTERYFEEIDILKEYYETKNIELPKYVYACFPIEFSLDMHAIVKDELLESHFEDAFDFVDKESLEELQKTVDTWTESQGIVSYERDWGTVILLD